MSVNDEVQHLVSKGWRIVSDGPSGVQLEGPKPASNQTAIGIGLGVLFLFLFWPIGVLFLAAALINHITSKKPSKFIPRG